MEPGLFSTGKYTTGDGFVLSFWRLIGFFAQSISGNGRSIDDISVILKDLFKGIPFSFHYSSSVA